MAVNPLFTTLPAAPSVPLINADGTMSQQWRFFFLALLTRTGGSGGISTGTVQQQLLALESQSAMDDVAFPSPRMTFAMDDVLGDVATPASGAWMVLLGQALSDSDAKPQINPLIAALLVSDASTT